MNFSFTKDDLTKTELKSLDYSAPVLGDPVANILSDVNNRSGQLAHTLSRANEAIKNPQGEVTHMIKSISMIPDAANAFSKAFTTAKLPEIFKGSSALEVNQIKANLLANMIGDVEASVLSKASPVGLKLLKESGAFSLVSARGVKKARKAYRKKKGAYKKKKGKKGRKSRR